LVPEEIFARAKRAELQSHLTNARDFLEHFKGADEEAGWRRTVASLERQLSNPATFRGLREQARKKQKPEKFEVTLEEPPSKRRAADKPSPAPPKVKLPPLPPLKSDAPTLLVDQGGGRAGWGMSDCS
jgi:hypothetical protein